MKILVILCLLVTIVNSHGCYREILIEQGRVRGWTIDDPHVFSFYGIPYASPPKGVDKFKAPLPPRTWSCIFNATEKGIACPQPGGRSSGMIITLDCLRLNIFMPAEEKPGRNVYVYFHGGEFVTGYSGNNLPVDLARRGIVVVTVNYRLGLYGFLCLNTEFAPGNAGIKDQLAALRWVHKNIVYFDGDKNKITLGGSGAGAASTEILMLNPVTSKYFVRALCESGSAIGSVTKTPLEIAKNHAFYFSPKSSISPIILEQIYRSLEDQDLNVEYKGNDIRGFTPCVETHNIPGEEKIIYEMPLRTLIRGNFERKPYMTGFTTYDGSDFLPRYDRYKTRLANNFSSFLPSSPNFASGKEKEKFAKQMKSLYFPKKRNEVTITDYLMYASDAYYRYPVILSSRLQTRDSIQPVYLYWFKFNGGIKIPHRYMIGKQYHAPGHMAQTLYIQEPPNGATLTADDLMVQDKVREMWTNFILTGNPVPQTTSFLPIKWTPVHNLSCHCMVIDRVSSMVEQPLRETVVPWDIVHNIQMPDYSQMPLKSYLAAFLALAGGAGVFYAVKK